MRLSHPTVNQSNNVEEITKTSGGFSDEVADSMKIAGTAAAVDIGIASTQVGQRLRQPLPESHLSRF